ncbi:MAG: DUF1893 domain-containing protein [Candidatus Izemoplasmatales bacterium]
MEKYLKLLGDHSLVLLTKDDEIIYTSDFKGVKPLLDFYHQYGTSSTPLTVLDKVMGRGAILLAKLVNVDKVFTPLISEDALALAREYKMDVTYNTLVPYIINNTSTGRCPIESSVLGISDTEVGYQNIIKTLASLSKKE